MARDSQDPVAAEWVVFRDLTAAGRSAEAIELAERIVAESHDPRRVAQALIEKLVGLINMGEARRFGPLLDQIHGMLRDAPDPRLIGEFHAMVAHIAFEHGSFGKAMMYAVHAERSLRRMNDVNLAAVDSWHDLASAYSLMGFHPKALECQREAARLCAAAGLSPAMSIFIEAQVRAALSLDQRGDTDGCVRHLKSLIAASQTLLPDLVVVERVPLRYAAQRLAALGHPVTLAVPPSTQVDDQVVADIVRLGDACEAIAAGDPGKAVAVLDDAPRAIDILGTAEPLRLRSLALTQLGDLAGALETERAILRLLTAEDKHTRDLFAASVSARLDQDRLRRVAVQYADQASTDPLTGLPNRRPVAGFVAGLARRGLNAMFGVLDLDGFKAVNDTHGHPSGDLVLQRIAGIFARTIRQGDLLTRHGGDEFVVILPGTSAAGAEEIGARIKAAVDAEDWDLLVPGTPVSVSIGWAELTGDADAALRAADDALYRIKRARAALPT
ncbi:diguanylate cyclase (GGDEF)-like protein [Allocatelliglobosispora scoriae]|uniref:Diguanylate cyclase (GGDEF)-like protein n=1 Tax=Allocatelliglobosispora scoriae TaxID=643052 RepID=A0A841BFJ6_9ACTN|nr:GGDEF domain-containing protein [Allocatelliglobosispora scoriae]MBB5867064.1 diguanylate cyclase (GGDEF)-like protein [Allocatelliglobosispora scoriae]